MSNLNVINSLSPFLILIFFILHALIAFYSAVILSKPIASNCATVRFYSRWKLMQKLNHFEHYL